MRRLSLLLFRFFFQAEDGIRDIGVTGVQTCALPISGDGQDAVVQLDLDVLLGNAGQIGAQDEVLVRLHQVHRRDPPAGAAGRGSGRLERAEERRVGEEWQSSWVASSSNKKKIRTQWR